MFRETMYRYAYIAIVCFATVSCISGSKSDSSAEQMLSQVKQLIDVGASEKAIALIDSINKSYSGETALLRRAMHLRTLADSVAIEKEILQTDSTISADSVIYAQLKNKFTFVKNANMVEGYYIINGLHRKPLYETTGLESRIDESGNAFVVSCVFGKSVKHTKLVAHSSRGLVAETKAVPYDGATNYRYVTERGNCEMVTFHSDKCENFLKFICENSESGISIDFVGKSNVKITLSKEQIKCISDTYRFSLAMQSGKEATAKKIYLQKKKEINRKQILRTLSELATIRK